MLTIIGEIRREDILITIVETEISVPAFLGTNYAFSKSGCGKNEAICKCNDLVGKKFQKAKDKSNEDRIKQIDFTK